MTKPCNKCKVPRPITEYYKRHSTCKICLRERRYESQYGLSVHHYALMFNEQDGKCAVCRGPLALSPHVDHCHTTLRVRGLLCHGCNIGLAGFKDNPENLQAAIHYLKETA